MTPTRALAVVAVLVIATHGAAAAPGFTALGLHVEGAATLDGDSDALFAIAQEDAPFAWTVTASRAVVERTLIPWYEVRDPTGRSLFQQVEDDKPRTERLVFTDVHLRSQGAEAHAALLARGVGLGATLVSAHGVSLTSVRDPTFHQVKQEVNSDADGTPLDIHETVPGAHVLAVASGAVLTLEGRIVLTLVGPDYALDAAEGALAGRTGWYTTRSVPGYAEGYLERQVVTLEDAFLRLDSPLDAHLLSAAPRVAFQGVLVAADPSGTFPLDLPAAGGAWTGHGALDLAPEEGRLAAGAPEPVRAAGAGTLARPPPVLAYALGAAALAAALAAAVALARRRAREADDPVALALLCMEDQRWEDALPHLDKALRRAPRDAKLLLDRALCLEGAGRLVDAADGYEAALRVEPSNPETHYYYARALTRLRQATSALAHLTRALAADARLKELARRDPAFAALREHPQVARLLE